MRRKYASCGRSARSAAVRAISLVLGKMAEPSQQDFENLVKIVGREWPEPVQGAHARKRGDTLDQKRAGLEKWRLGRDFERRTSQTGSVRDNADERAVLIANNHADDDRRTGLPRLTEVD